MLLPGFSLSSSKLSVSVCLCMLSPGLLSGVAERQHMMLWPFCVSKLSVSVLVSVVDWFAFRAKAVSTWVMVYVDSLFAFSANAAVMSAVLDLSNNWASTYAVVAFWC